MEMYSHKKKEKIADKISKIKNKRDLVKIYEIINSDKTDVTENSNGMFILFHNLSDSTYRRLEECIEKMDEEKKIDPNKNLEYKPYAYDEFPEQKRINPKLKYNNKEKNLIKRRRYNQNINSENNIGDNYCEFDISQITDSEKNT